MASPLRRERPPLGAVTRRSPLKSVAPSEAMPLPSVAEREATTMPRVSTSVASDALGVSARLEGALWSDNDTTRMAAVRRGRDRIGRILRAGRPADTL